jgi:hypothetical protein
MKKKAVVLAAAWLLAGFVSLEPALLPANPGPQTVSSRVGRVVLTGAMIAMAPVGVLVGCGGGSTGPSRTSATAVPLP